MSVWLCVRWLRVCECVDLSTNLQTHFFLSGSVSVHWWVCSLETGRSQLCQFDQYWHCVSVLCVGVSEWVCVPALLHTCIFAIVWLITLGFCVNRTEILVSVALSMCVCVYSVCVSVCDSSVSVCAVWMHGCPIQTFIFIHPVQAEFGCFSTFSQVWSISRSHSVITDPTCDIHFVYMCVYLSIPACLSLLSSCGIKCVCLYAVCVCLCAAPATGGPSSGEGQAGHDGWTQCHYRGESPPFILTTQTHTHTPARIGIATEDLPTNLADESQLIKFFSHWSINR